MTTPTETGLLRYAVIDGKTFIVDAEGRTLGQVVPTEPCVRMTTFVHRQCYLNALDLPDTVDLTGAVVKVPERKSENDDVDSYYAGWNDCLDALARK